MKWRGFIDDNPNQKIRSQGLSRIIMHRISTARHIQKEDVISTIELDCHADSAFVGSGYRVMERTVRKVFLFPVLPMS